MTRRKKSKKLLKNHQSTSRSRWTRVQRLFRARLKIHRGIRSFSARWKQERDWMVGHRSMVVVVLLERMVEVGVEEVEVEVEVEVEEEEARSSK